MAGYIGSKAVNLSTTGADINGDANIDGDLSFGDNGKAIFGAGSDLQIYHTGSVSVISDEGTGNLLIRGSDLRLQNTAGSNNYLTATDGAQVELMHGGATKLATTSSGASITGSLGIGTSSPSSILHVSSGDPEFILTDTSTNVDHSLDGNSGTGVLRLHVDKNSEGSDPSFIINMAGSEAMRIDSSGNVGIGASTPRTGLHLYGAGQTNSAISDSGSLGAFLRVSDTGAAGGSGGGVIFGTNASEADGFAGFAAIKGLLSNGDDRTIGALAFSMRASTTDTALTERMRLTSDGKLGIGTSSPEAVLDVAYNLPDDTNGIIRPLKLRTTDLANQTNLLAGDGVGILFEIPDQSSGSVGASIDAVKEGGADDDISTALSFKTSANNETLNEAMRIDSSGNLLVGTTNSLPADNNVEGIALSPQYNGGIIQVSRTGQAGLTVNRRTSDGNIALFKKDGSTVGSISTYSSDLVIGTGDTGLFFNDASDHIKPVNSSTGANRDNAIDLGSSGSRWAVVRAGTGSINTSDRNEKQDIEELSDAEQRVAVACKSLIRKFKFNDAVEAKGNDARIHVGIIAQDLQAAFASEGLDASRYAMFCSDTWTDEETGEERTRMGVRYSELLAFIIGAL